MLKTTSFILAIWLTISCPLLAQDSPLELFRSDVAAVIRLAEPDKTTEEYVSLINAAQPGFGEIARGVIPQNLGQAISNPDLTGADQSRDWHVGIYSDGKTEPVVVFVIPAVDTDDFQAALAPGFKSSVHGNYVVYTDQGELPQTPSAADSFATAISEKTKATLNLGEISLFVNSQRLTRVYAEELDTAYDQILQGLNQLRFAMPQESGINMGPVIEMYGSLAEKLFQGGRDSTAFTVTVDVGAKGVFIEEYLEFAENTTSAKNLAALQTSDMKELNQLPAGGFTYYGLSGGVDSIVKWSMDLSAGMSEDKATREQLQTAFDELKDVKFGTIVGSMAMATGNASGGLIEATSLATATPMDQVKKFMQQSMAAMKELKMPGLTQTTTIEQEAETYGDLKADVITVKQEFDENLPQAEMQQKLQEVMFGSAGIKSRVIYLDGKYLTVMGGAETATRKAIESLEGSANPAIEARRASLMEKANLIAFLDVPGAVAQGLKAAATLDEFPLPVDDQMIDALNLKTSFIGFGIGAEENAVRCQTDIPIEQIQGIYKISMLFVGLQNQL